MSLILPADGTSVDVIVPAAGSIAVWSQGQAMVYRELGFPNFPDRLTLLGTIRPGVQQVFGPFATGAVIQIQATGGFDVLYEVGASPIVQQWRVDATVQPTPSVLDATGTITPAFILSGIITSTTAAAVTATLPTGTVMDQASTFAIDDAISWTVINTGATNSFTLAAAAGHTIVGNAVTTLSFSGRYRTRKTAANTFVTYRLG